MDPTLALTAEARIVRIVLVDPSSEGQRRAARIAIRSLARRAPRDPVADSDLQRLLFELRDARIDSFARALCEAAWEAGEWATTPGPVVTSALSPGALDMQLRLNLRLAAPRNPRHAPQGDSLSAWVFARGRERLAARLTGLDPALAMEPSAPTRLGPGGEDLPVEALAAANNILRCVAHRRLATGIGALLGHPGAPDPRLLELAARHCRTVQDQRACLAAQAHQLALWRAAFAADRRASRAA